MAESSGEKTEQPSAKRLRDAREKGDIPKSQEVVSVATVCVVFGYFVGTAEDFYQRFLSVTEAVFTKGTTLPFDRAWQELFPMIIDTMVSFILPLVGCIFVTGVLAFMVQNGVVLAPKAAMPKLENLSPKKWFDKVFSKKNAFDFVMNLIKVGVLSSAVYIAVNNSIRPILSVNKSDIYGVLSLTGILIVDLFINVLVAFIVIAVFDWFYTRMTYTKKHMMTKEEVKKEYKEQEGDPIIKSKRKQLHQEMQNQSKLDKTRKAKVLIVNPTHYAVALFSPCNFPHFYHIIIFFVTFYNKSILSHLPGSIRSERTTRFRSLRSLTLPTTHRPTVLLFLMKSRLIPPTSPVFVLHGNTRKTKTKIQCHSKKHPQYVNIRFQFSKFLSPETV